MRRPLLPALILALSTTTVWSVGCGAAPRATTNTTQPPSVVVASAPAPQSLDEAMTRARLTRFEPTLLERSMTHLPSGGTTVEGRRVTMQISAGWSGETPIFARRDDGSVVLVDPQPNTIVDRHVNGGCRHFFGGRMWFETVVYELPEGARFEGTTPVRWDDHIEVMDYTPTEADGSPCPPPAID